VGAAASRRWQSREERVAELRAVLETAATLATAMQAIGDANRNVVAATHVPPSELSGESLDDAKGRSTNGSRLRLDRLRQCRRTLPGEDRG
jgi:hypothetical protein